ncbi:MAG: DEAD/DEAH box helicase family protein, partial [Campylobacterota bacterium]|nr:DEAD/DEAH box helicase family protein [Campylobacterota bacterium]
MTNEEINLELNKLYKQKKRILDDISKLEQELQEQSKTFISLKESISINTTFLSSNLIDDLKELATFPNPQIQILENLRKPIYNTPRTITSYIEEKNILDLPRGLMRGVIELFKRYNLDASFEDNRFIQKEIFKKIKYNVRDQQQNSIDAILKKDFCVCVAPPGFGKTFIGSKIIELRAVNTLVIVNKNMLLDQWIDRFIEYFGYEKEDIGYLGKSQ